MEAITTHKARELIKENINNPNFEIIDVRTKEEYDMGYIEGAINIPLDKIQEDIKNLDKDKEYLLYCRTQGRSQFAHQMFKSNGLNSKFILGGYLEWIEG